MSTILSNTITSVGGGGVSISVGNGATYISDGGAVTNSNVVQSLAKSYVFFDGTAGTPAAADSFNHSSITDSSTGNYRNVFTNTMANANFSGLISFFISQLLTFGEFGVICKLFIVLKLI